MDEADSVPCVALYAVPLTKNSSAPGEDVGPTVDVDTSDADGPTDPLAFTVRDESADFEMLGEPLADADRVPPVPYTTEPLTT